MYSIFLTKKTRFYFSKGNFETIWLFPKNRGKTPQNGWFTMENPYENGDDLGGLLGGSSQLVSS